MLTVDEALAEILRSVRPLPAVCTSLGDALGLVLAEEVISETDSPPFDKSLMDGYAIRTTDVVDGAATLKVIEEITAGFVPTKTLGPGEATRIMTGAPIPGGADAVVRIEETEFDADSGTVQLRSSSLAAGANLMRRGTAMKWGEGVLPVGRELRPQELGALAEMGQHEVAVIRRPSVAVLATGDELVPIHQTPDHGQIRNSNETMLAAQIRRSGGEPVCLGIARDEQSHLREKISVGLQSDVLVLSGGVSAGKLDLVPAELEAVGVRQIFHKVHIKPGKPVWFGVLDPSREDSSTAETRRRYVFGLPGNPVSSMVCFELFARSAIRRLMGLEEAAPRPVRARLGEEYLARGDRPTYHPARLDWNDAGPVVCPVNWHGSADLRATVKANAMALFPAGDAKYAAGEILDVYRWD